MLNSQETNEYGRICERLHRELCALDTLRQDHIDNPELKMVADTLYLLVYYRHDPTVIQNLRQAWCDSIGCFGNSEEENHQ